MKLKSFALLLMLTLTVGFSSMTVRAVTKTSTIRIQGMHCKNCSGSVEKALKATSGVSKVEVSLQRKEAVVEYDDEKVTEAKLREVINATGFKAVEENPNSQ